MGINQSQEKEEIDYQYSEKQVCEQMNHLTRINNYKELSQLINQYPQLINHLNNQGESLLYVALKFGHYFSSAILFLQGVNIIPPVPYNGNPLHMAVLYSHKELVRRFLRETEIFPSFWKDEQDERGWTPLHISVTQGNADIVALLMKYNANLIISDRSGRTPKDLASNDPCRQEILEMLSVGKLQLREQKSTQSLLQNTEINQFSQSRLGIDHTQDSISDSLQENPHDYLERKLLENSHYIPKIDFNELNFLEQINRGSSCLVFRGRWRKTEVAIKQFKLEYGTNKKEMMKFIKEISVLMRVRHPNLLLLMGVCLEGPYLCLITEYMNNNTLFYALHKNKKLKLSLMDRLQISIQIAKGVVYLHNNKPPIVHRDLKPENCLMDMSLNVKIADFGLARPLSLLEKKLHTTEDLLDTTGSKQQSFQQFNFEQLQKELRESEEQEETEGTTLCIGTTRFMAPELFDKDNLNCVSVKIDVWAFGCLMIEIFSGKRPWDYISSANVSCIYYEIFNQKPIPIPSTIDPSLRELIRSCCNYDPTKRPTIDEVLTRLEEIHEYFTQTDH